MVCLRNISVGTLHKGDTEDNNNFLIDVPFKVIFLGLNILGAAMDLLLAAFRGVFCENRQGILIILLQVKFLHSVHTFNCCVNGNQTDFELETPLKKTCFRLIVCSPNPTFSLPKVVVLFPTLTQRWMQTRSSFQPDFFQVCQNLKWTAHSYTYQDVCVHSLVMQHCSKKEEPYQHLAVKYRVGRGSDILRSVGKLFDHFVGHSTVHKTKQNCIWVSHTSIIRVRTE
jgi:hypothetical protein